MNFVVGYLFEICLRSFTILLIAVCKDIKHREKEEELHFSGEMRI